MDLNQVTISALMAQIGNHKNIQIDENMLRHMVLNMLRSYNTKFKHQYGEMVICVDSRNSWRRKFFPYYKAARRKSREASELDWTTVFAFMQNIKEEIDLYLPYKLIGLDGCEADDLIGTIIHYEGSLDSKKPILILSGDKDFIQLHTYSNVSQYDSTRKRSISNDDPDKFLFEHIIKGDLSDGVPNIFSADNCFTLNIRQNNVTAKKLQAGLDNKEQFIIDNYRNWIRNSTLIDLKNTPEDLKAKIILEYEKPNPKNRSKMMEYFIDKKLRLLIEYIGDF